MTLSFIYIYITSYAERSVRGVNRVRGEGMVKAVKFVDGDLGRDNIHIEARQDMKIHI